MTWKLFLAGHYFIHFSRKLVKLVFVVINLQEHYFDVKYSKYKNVIIYLKVCGQAFTATKNFAISFFFVFIVI